MMEEEQRIYTREEAEENCKKYFGEDNELGIHVFLDKYALKDDKGNFLEDTPDKMHVRMAKEFARIEKKYKNSLSESEIYDLFDHFKYLIPGGSIMASLGDKSQISSLSNCSVIELKSDSYGGILFADQQIVQLSKRRAGVGIEVSCLRPRGVKCTNAAKSSTGGISFMERFSNSARECGQSGRRGALMISCDISYYDVEEFIKIKQDLSKVTGANISVQISDEFMQAVKEDNEFTLQWPVNTDKPQISKRVKARDLWNLLIECSTKTGEPGVMFKTRGHLYSPSSIYPQYRNITSNPCVVGDTLISTNAGLKTVESLAKENLIFKVKSYNELTNEVEFKKATAFQTKINAKVLKLKTKDGNELKLTPEHLVFTQRGWICAAQLKTSDKILSIK